MSTKRRTPDDFASDVVARREEQPEPSGLGPQQAEERLPRLIEQAASALAKATSAGEVLEARNQAAMAYDAAKVAARFAKLKDAHAEILAACHRAQADALIIEARAQCRLADEYDAAQERGEVAKQGGARNFKIPNENFETTTADIGLTNKQVHEARKVRDAEKAEPGIVQRTVDAKLEAGDEPTRAEVRRAVNRTAASTVPKNKNAAAEPELQQWSRGGEQAKVAMHALCWLVLAAGDLGDPDLVDHLTHIAAAQDPDPFPASAVDRVIAVLTEVALRLRAEEARRGQP
jgi:hypothetical protein